MYWQVRLDDQATEPYIVALATSVAVIGICTEAFSGLTTVLWQQGHVVSSGDAAPSLWAVEHYYLWHLVDAIPLLEVPQTIRWSEPQGFDDQWSGALLLLFKIMVIIPLVRVGFSGYALAQDGVVRVYKALRKERSKTARDDVDTGRRTDWESTPTSAVEVWLAVAVLLVATVAGWFLLWLVIAPSSVAHTWLTARFPDGIHFGDYGVDLPWLLKGVDGVTAAIVLLVVLSMMSGLAGFLGEAMGLRGRASRAGVLVATILTLGPAIIAATAVSIALLHVGWAEATPTIPPVDEVNATVNWYGWHLADLLPILDLPDTMNWVVNFEYVDRWSAFVMLGAKLLLIGLLGWPIAILARMSLEQARDRRPKPALLGVTGRFGVLLDELMSGADAAEQRVRGDPARHRFGAGPRRSAAEPTCGFGDRGTAVPVRTGRGGRRGGGSCCVSPGPPRSPQPHVHRAVVHQRTGGIGWSRRTGRHPGGSGRTAAGGGGWDRPVSRRGLLRPRGRRRMTVVELEALGRLSRPARPPWPARRSRSAPIVVESPWPVCTTVSSGSAQQRCRGSSARWSARRCSCDRWRRDRRRTACRRRTPCRAAASWKQQQPGEWPGVCSTRRSCPPTVEELAVGEVACRARRRARRPPTASGRRRAAGSARRRRRAAARRR